MKFGESKINSQEYIINLILSQLKKTDSKCLGHNKNYHACAVTTR